MLGVVGVGGSISSLYNAGPSIFKHQRDSGWVGATRRVAMDTSSAGAFPSSTNFVGTNAQSSSISDEFNRTGISSVYTLLHFKNSLHL